MGDDRQPLEREPGRRVPPPVGEIGPGLPPVPDEGSLPRGKPEPAGRDLDDAVIGMYFMG